MPGGWRDLAENLETLKGWAITNCVQFNRRKCQILHLRLSNPASVYRMEDERLESCPEEKDLADGKLNLSMHWYAPGSTALSLHEERGCFSLSSSTVHRFGITI